MKPAFEPDVLEAPGDGPNGRHRRTDMRLHNEIEDLADGALESAMTQHRMRGARRAARAAQASCPGRHRKINVGWLVG